MAERRMFAKTIIDSDAFLDMPMSARLLYYDLSMRADDDGFVNSPKKIMRMVGATLDDLNILCVKKFIIPFDSGIVVIKHWKIHNYIRKDTYSETPYREELSMLSIDENKAYTLSDTSRRRAVDEPSTQVSIGKVSIGKDSIESNATATPSPRFSKPTVEEVTAYCKERGNHIDAQQFFDFYESKGWKVGNQSMKDWKACVRTWERRDKKTDSQHIGEIDIERHEYSADEINNLYTVIDDEEI